MAMVTWRMEKNVTVEKKRCVCVVSLECCGIYFPCMFLPGLMTLLSATLFV